MKTKMLIILMAVVVAGWFAGCAGEEAPVEVPEATPEATACPPCPEVTPCPECPEPSVPAGTVDCDACHAKSTEYVPHVKGGQYCFNCHGSDPHVIHTGEGTANLECGVCHGTGGEFITGDQFRQLAADMPAGTSCELCHDPVDPVKPSEGNLVNIHLPRDKPCTVCHTQDLNVLHISADGGTEAQE